MKEKKWPKWKKKNPYLSEFQRRGMATQQCRSEHDPLQPRQQGRSLPRARQPLNGDSEGTPRGIALPHQESSRSARRNYKGALQATIVALRIYHLQGSRGKQKRKKLFFFFMFFLPFFVFPNHTHQRSLSKLLSPPKQFHQKLLSIFYAYHFPSTTPSTILIILFFLHYL